MARYRSARRYSKEDRLLNLSPAARDAELALAMGWGQIDMCVRPADWRTRRNDGRSVRPRAVSAAQMCEIVESADQVSDPAAAQAD